MPDNEFQVEAIGAVYAQALINEAQKRGTLADVTDDVRGIGQLLKDNPSFLAYTQALTIGEDERQATLEKIFSGRIDQLTLEVIKSMARRDRLMFLRGMVEGFEDIIKKLSGHVDVTLTTASALAPEVVQRIAQAVNESLGITSDVVVTVDSRLIGGMTLTVGDTLIDGSVATQLEKIQEQLKRKGVGQLKLSAVVA